MTQTTFIAVVLILSAVVLWFAEPTPCGSQEQCEALNALGVSQQEQY